jgi:NAD(P)H-nitrite reductase large subunit
MDLDGVFSPRTLTPMRDAAESAKRAVVVGGGFIGTEVAASLRSRDLDVALVHLGSGLFEQFGCEQPGSELVAMYRAHGVQLPLGEEVASFAGGSTPSSRSSASASVAFLRSSGLPLDNGVVVDDRRLRDLRSALSPLGARRASSPRAQASSLTSCV